jgi:sialic acid synthase SpsE/GNAT superfamily N-acetyltransferase
MPMLSNDHKVRLEIVLKDEIEARQILDWRNDPVTLEMSCDSREKTFEQFFSDFCSKYFLLPDLPPLFCLLGATRVGYAYFRPMPEQDVAEISIAIGPEWRAKGIGTRFLKALDQHVCDRGYRALFAYIKPQNFASRRLFEHAGYTYAGKAAKSGLDLDLYIKHFRKKSEDVFIVGEAGSNWNVGDDKKNLDMAKAMIAAAKEAGCDAVKFQTFRAETVYAKGAGRADYLEIGGIHKDIEQLFSDLSMQYEMIPKLAEYARAEGIEFMSSAFSPIDFKAVDPYVKRHKIASYENCHVQLLELAARTQKPLILSCGASTVEDIAFGVDTFKKAGGKDLTLLQCTAKYPAPEIAMHLCAMKWLERKYNVPCGLSDHSIDPIAAPLAACALGAKVIEKHFTLSRELPGPDQCFSITPDELKYMCEEIRKVEKMLGEYVKKVDPQEEELVGFARRYVQTLKKITKGDTLHLGDNIALLRPGKRPKGAHPRMLAELEGKKALRDIERGEGVHEGDW